MEAPILTRSIKRLIVLFIGVAALLVAIYVGASSLLDKAEEGPSPDTIARTSLQALQTQNRLVPFTARYVSVVTSRQRRFGGLLEAERTLVLPGTARYEIDMAKLDADALSWDEATRTLTVEIPDIEVSGPDVDLAAAREYGETGLLGAVTSADEVLTDANRKGALADLRRQARSDTPMRLARDAARDAIAANFALPLAAAGIEDVTIVTRFPFEGVSDGERWDVSTRPQDAIEARRRRAAQGE